MLMRLLTLWSMSFFLVSCTQVPVKPVAEFKLDGREYLYGVSSWVFFGRLALSNEDRSMSASIKWLHKDTQDEIELSGPFGQGRIIITIAGSSIIIDDGENKSVQYSGAVDELVSERLGIKIPVMALKYWLIGLLEPDVEYKSFNDGFSQAGWRVRYLQMQQEGRYQLPRKMRLEQGGVKLKLIVNRWDI